MRNRPVTNFRNGEFAGNIKAQDIRGNNYALSELRGKIVVINFWFIRCLPCRQEIPELNKIVTSYKDSTGIVFLAFAIDSETALREYLKTTPFNYSIIAAGRSIARSYGITAYPTNLVIDKKGKLYFQSSGSEAASTNGLRSSIEQLMNPAANL